MKLAKEWGANDYNRALRDAALGNHTAAMKLLIEWSANDYNKALVWAAGAGSLEAMELLKEWGANDFTGSLHEVVTEAGSLESLELMKRWRVIAAGDITRALKDTQEDDHRKFLESWLAELQ